MKVLLHAFPQILKFQLLHYMLPIPSMLSVKPAVHCYATYPETRLALPAVPQAYIKLKVVSPMSKNLQFVSIVLSLFFVLHNFVITTAA